MANNQPLISAGGEQWRRQIEQDPMEACLHLHQVMQAAKHKELATITQTAERRRHMDEQGQQTAKQRQQTTEERRKAVDEMKRQVDIKYENQFKVLDESWNRIRHRLGKSPVAASGGPSASGRGAPPRRSDGLGRTPPNNTQSGRPQQFAGGSPQQFAGGSPQKIAGGRPQQFAKIPRDATETQGVIEKFQQENPNLGDLSRIQKLREYNRFSPLQTKAEQEAAGKKGKIPQGGGAVKDLTTSSDSRGDRPAKSPGPPPASSTMTSVQSVPNAEKRGRLQGPSKKSLPPKKRLQSSDLRGSKSPAASASR